MTGETICDTSDYRNWGSRDANHVCFDYFPIILVDGEVETIGIDGQGIVVLEWNGGVGGEFDLEVNSTFREVILAKGCIEITSGSTFYSAVFVNGDPYSNNGLCGSDEPLKMSKDGTSLLQRSQCAVDRALYHSTLGVYAEVLR